MLALKSSESDLEKFFMGVWKVPNEILWLEFSDRFLRTTNYAWTLENNQFTLYLLVNSKQ